MRSFSFIHILLLLVFLLAYQCSHAQDYLVTTRGDTVSGKIKIFNFGTDKKVQVTADGRKKETYPMTQVKSIFYEGDTFHPQKGPQGYAFMKLIQEGYLSLYAFQQENQVSYDGLLLAKKDGNSIEVPNLNFKKALKRFLDDCEAVSANIEEGDYSKKDLNKLITDYNNCINNKSTSNTARPVASQPAPVPEKKSASLAALEEKLTAHPEFDGKADALEMVAEIRKKVARGEKVPNFLTEGLKNALKNTSLEQELNAALEEVK